MMIVFNPVAGRRRAALLWRVLDVLVANGVRLDLAETRCSGDAACLAREAAARGETMVVAAGGDGTIAEVANGLLGTGARLGVIPLGTANVLAHELALPFAPARGRGGAGVRADADAVARHGARRRRHAAVRADAGHRVRRACGAPAAGAAEAGVRARRLRAADAARRGVLPLSADHRAAG